MVDTLNGARILIVEDEWMVANLLAELLTEHSCKVVGPATNVADALVLASAETIDAAILDLNVKGENVYPVARVLTERNIPFSFITGYRADKIIETYRDRLALQKPVHPKKLLHIISDMLTNR